MRRKVVLLTLLLVAGGLGLRGDTGRARNIGAQLICSCGCGQGALVCNHVGCPVVTHMRQEITQRSASGASDAQILQSFVQEYGTQVLANPTTSGFNLLAWIMPWVAVGLGLWLVLFVVRRWAAGAKAAAALPTPAADDAVQQRVQREIDAEMRREF